MKLFIAACLLAVSLAQTGQNCCAHEWQDEGQNFCSLEAFVKESVDTCGMCLFDRQCKGYQEAYDEMLADDPSSMMATGLVYCCPDAKRCVDRRNTEENPRGVGCPSGEETADCGFSPPLCGQRLANSPDYPKNCADVGCGNPNFPRLWMEAMSCSSIDAVEDASNDSGTGTGGDEASIIIEDENTDPDNNCCNLPWQEEGQNFCNMNAFIEESVDTCGMCLFDHQCKGYQEAYDQMIAEDPNSMMATGLVYCCPDAKRCLDRRITEENPRGVGCPSGQETADCGYGPPLCGQRMANSPDYPKNCADVGCGNPNFPQLWMQSMSCSSNPDSTVSTSNPCDCAEGTGYDSETMMCAEGSTTRCWECTTMEGCVMGSCADECYEYNEMMTCQCNDECVEYGNCCTDINVCMDTSVPSNENTEFDPFVCVDNDDACFESCTDEDFKETETPCDGLYWNIFGTKGCGESCHRCVKDSVAEYNGCANKKVTFELSLGMSKAEFEENENAIKQSIANALGVPLENLRLTVKTNNRLRRYLDDAIQVEAIVLTSSEDAIMQSLTATAFASNVQEQMSQAGVVADVADVEVLGIQEFNSPPTMEVNIASPEPESMDERTKETYSAAIIIGMVIACTAAAILLYSLLYFCVLKNRDKVTFDNGVQMGKEDEVSANL